ncbi:hypothetical protein SAMN04488587_0795 [Methanococcoides vulcani]|uniref:Uncharacterized protein n=1 Tax=Methanococcoides vulcani TaxID=1353158 RepID=A0A1H9Z0Y0_9EURY|nr:hypothetical protein [Methanococcoides vulcani]SES75154.1 hypothetical protein SAMN04488587_0795 [Methanococcoides vulcani]
MKNYCPAISAEIERYTDGDQQRYTINCCKESSSLTNMWKLKMMDIRSRSNSPFEPPMDVPFGSNSHYWTDTNGLNIQIGSCDTNMIGYSRKVISKFISTIFLQEFPDMEPANARTFGNDLADEINMLDHMDPGKDNARMIRIEWSSMALVFFYNETQPNDTIPLLIDDRCHNIRKKR